MGERKWLRDLYLNNAGIKALSLLLALLSFFAIRGATSYEVSYQIPLEVRVEKGTAILDLDVRTVDVVFRGSQQDILGLDEKLLHAVIKPKVIDPSGSESVLIGPSDIEGMPRGVRAAKVRPSVINLSFDHEVRKQVAVMKPQTIGKPLAGKAEIDYEPHFITIRGPERRLRNREALVTEPVDVDGRVASFVKEVRVLPPSDSWVAHFDPTGIVTARVSIITESVTRYVASVPVMAIARPGSLADVAFDPATVKVSLQGRAELLDGLSSNAVRVFVDCEGLDASTTYELPVSVHLPPLMDEVSARVDPEQVKVKLNPRPSALGG